MTETLLVEKQKFELPELRTVGGAVLRNVVVGYETYGQLNDRRDNAILVAHFFSGTSHAAGRYSSQDPQPGYWDAIIGPGKAVDTNKYFVIASDTLVNMNPGDEKVFTTGPASIDPATGKRYGMTFPAVAIADFVRVQKALVESLGVERLHAVMGPSMGGLQTFEWAASYPDCVGRIIPVISAPNFGGWLTGWLSIWVQPIRLDPAWRGGAYEQDAPPLAGLSAALQTITLHALSPRWADIGGGGRALASGGNAADVATTPFAIEKTLQAAAGMRVRTADANHLLYLARANQTYVPGAGAGATSADEGLKRVRAPALVLYAPDDQVFPSEWVESAVALLRENGVAVETGHLHGPYGHYNGIMCIGDASRQIAEFLSRPF